MACNLSIVIPAYNEEDSIVPTLERTLAAIASIKEQAGVDSVEIIVVNDGSRDRTSEKVREFLESTKHVPGVPCVFVPISPTPLRNGGCTG